MGWLETLASLSIAGSIYTCRKKSQGPYGLGQVSFGDATQSMKVVAQMDTESLERLVTVKMPYGKYQGTILADLPGNYLNWFAREGFPPGNLGRLLALMHELDHNGLSGLLKPLRANHAR